MCQSGLTGQVNCQVGLASFLSNPDFDLKLNDINTDVLSLQLLGDLLCETSLETLMAIGESVKWILYTTFMFFSEIRP